MTQEDKKLLLKDLCARLPYGVYIEHTTTGIRGKLADMVFQHKYNNTDSIQDVNAWIMFFGNEYVDAIYFKSILRSMSSMTDEERKEYLAECDKDDEDSITTPRYHGIDWLNAHHFDYRGLIPMGLALPAPEGMYNIK